MASASMDVVIKAEHRSPTDPRSPGQTLRTRGGCSYSSRRTPFLMQENPGLGVGAPPSVRKGVEPEHLRTRLGCSYGSRRTRFWCRRIPIWMWEHRPRCERESSQSTFAPGAGAPTVREEPGFGVGESRFGCGSTAPGANPVWV